MEDPEPVSNEAIKDSAQSTAGFPRSKEGHLPETIGDAPKTTTVGSLISVEHGPPPIVTTTPDFAESTSSNIHPFKLERFTDSKGNTRTRVYVGKLRYCINTFDIEIKKDKKGTTTYGSLGSTNTGSESSHTHSGTSSVPLPAHTHTQDGTAVAKTGNDITTGNTENESSHTHSVAGIEIPEHKHVARDSTEDGLLMPNHEHDAGTSADNLKIPQHQHEIGISGDTESASAGGYNHYHQIYINQQTNNIVSSNNLSVTGKTDEVTDYDSSSSNVVKKVTGKTGGIFEKNNNDNLSGATAAGTAHSHQYNKDDHSHTLTGQTGGIYGSAPTIDVTTGSGSPHNHPLPDLSTATSEADRFVCIKTQGQGAGIIKEVEPTGFTALKDSDDKDTVVKTKTLPIGDTYGSIFLRWKLVLVENNSLDLQTINQADVTIYRHSDPTKTAEQLITDNFEKLTDLRGVDLPDNNPASGTDMDAFKRGSETEDDRTAYYYVKIGNSYDPNAAGTNSKTIEQITYENVYWSPFFLPRYTGAIS